MLGCLAKSERLLLAEESDGCSRDSESLNQS